MARRKRIEIISTKLIKIANLTEIETQKLRATLISELEQIFTHAVIMAKSSETPEEWMRIAGYIAQTINSLAKTFDETRFNEDIQRLREMIENAKKHLRQAGAGAQIA
ncbi:MAG: hypothetical protein QW782_01945 [Candidatus Bathyarchaeia archaeon]